MSKVRPFLGALEEVFGFAIGDQDAKAASTLADLAGCLAAWFSRLGDPEPVLVAGSFVRLRQVLADGFNLPKASVRPATTWEEILSGFPPEFRRRKWRSLRKSLDGLPRLTGPSWPWILLDLACIPLAPLLYSAAGEGIRGTVWCLGFLLLVGLSSLGMSRGLASSAPHKTIGESARSIAAARMKDALGRPDWMRAEIRFVLREVLDVELGGKHFADETPFHDMGLA